MRFLESISVGIKALLINKLRCLLTTLGICFGLYPAVKAMRLSAIEALRAE